MKLKFTNPILPIGEIKITEKFSSTMPRLEKLKKCMDFYRANGYFDRQIIVASDKTLHDGYCAYLTAYLLDVEWVKVLMVGEGAEPIKVVAPDKLEPVKLYCVRSYEPGHWFTKGKVYETDCNDQFTTDDGYHPNGYEWRDDWDLGREKWSAHFVPLVQRPAKVGEWVYVTDVHRTTCNGRKPGDIFLIDGDEERPEYSENGFIWGSGLYLQGVGDDGGHYLVLDGYKGDAE